jgi:hypothetical protein
MPASSQRRAQVRRRDLPQRQRRQADVQAMVAMAVAGEEQHQHVFPGIHPRRDAGQRVAQVGERGERCVAQRRG